MGGVRGILDQVKEVVVHPCFYVGEEVGENGESDGSDGVGRDVQLKIVGVAMEM